MTAADRLAYSAEAGAKTGKAELQTATAERRRVQPVALFTFDSEFVGLTNVGGVWGISAGIESLPTDRALPCKVRIGRVAFCEHFDGLSGPYGSPDG